MFRHVMDTWNDVSAGLDKQFEEHGYSRRATKVGKRIAGIVYFGGLPFAIGADLIRYNVRYFRQR
jgi:hypothetical protein